jgi:hypothetical protein
MVGLINTIDMKAKFLKIAGVKNESEFYKKYPTEAAFFKAHPEAKKEVKKAQTGDQVVDPELMQEWNNYVQWLGPMKGKPELDKDSVGLKKLEEYRKLNPKTRLGKEAIPSIQNTLQDYRNWVIEGHKTGVRPVKFNFPVNEDYSNFMPFIYQYEQQGRKWGDGYPGQYTTSVMFPSEYLNEKRQGFAVNKSKFQTGGNIGEFVGGDVTDFQPINFQEVRDQQDLILTGMTDEMRKEEAYKQQMLQAEKQQAAKDSKNMLGNLLGNIMGGGGSGVTSGGATAEDVSQLAELSGKKGAKIKKGKGGLQQFAGNMGGPMGIADAAQNIIRGIQMLKEQKEALSAARQATAVSDVALQAASTRPEIAARRYTRPEDNMVTPGQAFMSYGTGTNFLQAEDGAMIGGNPTEIQNMYNPGTLYSDLGFEPLQDSDRVKQYKRGGYLPMAQGGFNLKSFANKGGFDVAGQFTNIVPGVGQDAGSSIGQGVGEVVGSLIGIPGMGNVGELIGGLVDRSAEKMEKEQKKQQKNLSKISTQQGARAIQGQYSGFVRNGGDVPMGEHGWVSHDWQPQVITKFGEYDVKDLLKPPADADMLRTGGNLRQNYVDPEEQMAFGGEMKTHWGGYAEPISQNPYLPGTGETVMFRGQSHDESDGKGRTGIGVSYGPTGNDTYTDYAEYGTKAAENKVDVEVERGEPATESGDGSMVVYGNLMVPKQSISEIGDPSLSHNKPIKFKNLVKKYSEQEEKANKKIEKATSALDNITPVTSLDKLALNTQNVIIDAENEKLKRLAQYKINAAALQQAINKTAEEMGVDADALAKGKIKTAKADDMARNGKEIESAQKGKKQKKQKELSLSEVLKKSREIENAPTPINLTSPSGFRESIDFSEADDFGPSEYFEIKGVGPGGKRMPGSQTLPTKIKQKEPPDKKETTYDYAKALSSQLTPILNRPLQEQLNALQFLGEFTALGNNQLQSVQAQTFQPLLATPMSDVSFQNRLNENQATFNALQRILGYNPAALSQLAGQKYAANSEVLADQFRMNQQMENEVINKNRELLNDAQLKNLAILDQQYTRQEQARSNTKATFQEAMNSIASKTLQNKLENRTLATYSNLFPQYGFTPDMMARNRGLTLFDFPEKPGYKKVVDENSGNVKYEKQKTTDAKNGGKTKKHSTNASILKMYKG